MPVNPRMHNFALLQPGRRALAWLGATLVCLTLPVSAGNLESIKVQVDPSTAVSRISPGFIGFGYETSAVAQTNYFSAKNAVLIRLYRNLSSQGLIRIGGNISDHTRYVPDGIATVRSEREVTIINRRSLADLAGFARATGWKIMWGLNLGTGSKAEAAQEAEAVAAALGDHLQSFQIGNEVDLRGRYNLKYDDFESYYTSFLAFKTDILKAVPKAVFSGPDVAVRLDWLGAFAQAEGRDVKLLTHHYYRTGASTPGATIENLLQPDAGWQSKLRQLQKISQDSGVPFRVNEVNSFYGGGKAGVSDTFASALWCLDYMFELAAYGGDGINLETDINQLAWISHYSPIVHDAPGNCQVRPEYYGMLAFALAGHGELLKCILDQGDINLSAHATRDEHGVLWLTVVNKDPSRDAELEIRQPGGYVKPEAFRLAAPSVDSKDRVTLGGAAVSAKGKWSPRPPEKLVVNSGSASVVVPHASAVLVRWHRRVLASRGFPAQNFRV